MIRPVLFGCFGLVFICGCSTGPKQPSAVETEAAQLADKAKGAELFATCVACHGDQGQGVEVQAAPSIGGHEAWYLEAQINAFRNGWRGNDPADTVGNRMAAIAKTIVSEADVANVAAHIAALPSIDIKPSVEGNIDKGRDYYNMICGACHGTGAVGNKALHSPKLAGLDGTYMLGQLRDFRSGLRGTHPKDVFGAQMRTMAKTIPDEQTMLNLVAYLESL